MSIKIALAPKTGEERVKTQEQTGYVHELEEQIAKADKAAKKSQLQTSKSSF